MKISKEATIGLLVVAAITIFIWGINFLKGNSLFSIDKTFYAKYSRVDGLKKSSPVTLNGFKVGQIKSIEFSKSSMNSLIVSFSISEGFDLPKNTTAHIVSSDIMGTKEIQIAAGDSKKVLKSGDTIQGTFESDLKEQVSKQMLPIKNKAEHLMSSIDSTLNMIQNIFNEDTQANITQTFEHIKNSSSSLDTLVSGDNSQLKKIISNIESITQNLDSNGENINNILKNFSSISDSLKQAEITSTINNANAALAQVNSILEQINSGKGSMGALLKNDSLYQNIESATKHLDQLLVDFKNHPKRYVHISVFGRKDKKKKK